jgi:hypothetical protein
MRRTLSPAFTSSKMKMLFTLMSETSKQLITHLENCLREQEAAAEHKPVCKSVIGFWKANTAVAVTFHNSY